MVECTVTFHRRADGTPYGVGNCAYDEACDTALLLELPDDQLPSVSGCALYDTALSNRLDDGALCSKTIDIPDEHL